MEELPLPPPPLLPHEYNQIGYHSHFCEDPDLVLLPLSDSPFPHPPPEGYKNKEFILANRLPEYKFVTLTPDFN